MDGVQFEEQDDFQIARPTQKSSPSGSTITQLFMKMGFGKTQKDAEYVMIATAIVAFALAAFFIYSFVFPHAPHPNRTEVLQIQEMTHHGS